MMGLMKSTVDLVTLRQVTYFFRILFYLFNFSKHANYFKDTCNWDDISIGLFRWSRKSAQASNGPQISHVIKRLSNKSNIFFINLFILNKGNILLWLLHVCK